MALDGEWMARLDAESARALASSRRLTEESGTLRDEELVSRLLGMDPIPALQLQRLLNDPVLYHTVQMAAILYRETKRLESDLEEARWEVRRLEAAQEEQDW